MNILLDKQLKTEFEPCVWRLKAGILPGTLLVAPAPDHLLVLHFCQGTWYNTSSRETKTAPKMPLRHSQVIAAVA